jgi:hypothetical protein
MRSLFPPDMTIWRGGYSAIFITQPRGPSTFLLVIMPGTICFAPRIRYPKGLSENPPVCVHSFHGRLHCALAIRRRITLGGQPPRGYSHRNYRCTTRYRFGGRLTICRLLGPQPTGLTPGAPPRCPGRSPIAAGYAVFNSCPFTPGQRIPLSRWGSGSPCIAGCRIFAL